MIEQQEMLTIEKANLVETVAALRTSGWRLVQICASTATDRYEMNYSFDKDRQFRNLRFTVVKGETVPSIGLIYGNAFLYENEIHDLFGITIEHMTIDYHGTLYKTRIPTPFALNGAKPATAAGAPSVQAKPAAESTAKKEEPHG